MSRLYIIFYCCMLLQLAGVSQPTLQLSSPLLQYPTLFFTDSVRVPILFDMKGTDIHYTLNGRIPEPNDPVYRRPIIVRQFTQVQARVFGNGYLASDVAAATFCPAGYSFQITGGSQPDDRYTGQGLRSLQDNHGGIPDHTQPGWLGFQQDTVRIMLTVPNAAAVGKLMLETLLNDGAWIVLPRKIMLFAVGNNQRTLIGEYDAMQDTITRPAGCQLLWIAITPQAETHWELSCITEHALPPEHPGAGQHGWFFMDEIKLY